jgi:hypothetical protein
MNFVRTAALWISLGVFLSILFYFEPKAMDRLRAKAPPSRQRTGAWLWWHTYGWVVEPEAIVALFWFAMLFVSLGAVFLLSGK